jgi:EmrB/QacA subfamily drug resistance transporter
MNENLNNEQPSKHEIRIVFTGLMLALALSALDQNIVSTALPRIVGDLGGLNHLSWVVTAFMLTSTTTTPVYGKLSDLYGRKPMFFTAIILFLIGSVLCGAAQTMFQLILFRAAQGLGAGGLITLAQTTIADLISPRERGRYQGIFAGVFAVCSVAGPLLGGLITDVLSWRWIFYINIPVGVAALLLIAVGFRCPHRAVAHHIDYLGVILLTATTSCLLLVLTWGGTTYPWSSSIILGLAAGTAVFLVMLIINERRAIQPILPVHLFDNRVFVISIIVIGITFMALFNAAVFLPLYFQLVRGASPSVSGLMMAPLMTGVIISSFVGGRIVTATGRYKIFPVIGLATASLSYFFIAQTALSAAHLAVIEAAIMMLGLGMGLVMPNLITAIQNAVPMEDLGTATSTSSFFRSLGGAVGVAISGAVVTYELHDFLTAVMAGSPADIQFLLERGTQQMAGLSVVQQGAVVDAYRHAISAAFFTGAVLSGIAFAIVLFLPERPLRSTVIKSTDHLG